MFNGMKLEEKKKITKEIREPANNLLYYLATTRPGQEHCIEKPLLKYIFQNQLDPSQTD
jgi:hypothetical protein